MTPGSSELVGQTGQNCRRPSERRGPAESITYVFVTHIHPDIRGA